MFKVESDYYQNYFRTVPPTGNKDVLTHEIECSVCGHCTLYNKSFTEEEAREYHLKGGFHLNKVEETERKQRSDLEWFSNAIAHQRYLQSNERDAIYKQYRIRLKDEWFGVYSIYREFYNGLRKLRRNNI